MNVTDAKYIKSATRKQDYPESKTVEFAFIGKSNVGKSSLINRLTNRKILQEQVRLLVEHNLLIFF